MMMPFSSYGEDSSGSGRRKTPELDLDGYDCESEVYCSLLKLLMIYCSCCFVDVVGEAGRG